MGANYKILMHRYNGTDYDNLYPESAESTTVFNGYATPQQYGAVADGSQDDSQPIQDALDSGKIVILEGTFLIDAGVTLPSNAYLIGQNCTIVPSYDTNGIPKTAFSASNVNDIVFQNINFVGTYSEGANDNLYAPSLIDINGGNSVVFENCLFKDINGVACLQYNDSTVLTSFWKQNGSAITCRGVENTTITNCVLDHTSRNAAIWILPLPNTVTDAGAALAGIHVDVRGLQCLGITQSNPPLNILCESANISDIYYDSNCSGDTSLDSSAAYLFAYNLNVDNVQCLGNYEYVLNCDGLGVFENDNVNISNVNVGYVSNTTSVAISTIAKSCNISNLTGLMNCAVLVHNIISNLETSYFPWKYVAPLGSPVVNITNSNIQSYNGDHAVFMIEGDMSKNNGELNISNSSLEIVTVNTKYQPFTLFGGSLIMNGVTVNGDCSATVTNNFNDFDYGYNAGYAYGSYISYYGGINTQSTEAIKITSISSNVINVSGCVFKRSVTGSSNALYLCVVHGCLRSVCIKDNDLYGLLRSNGVHGSIIIGNYADYIIVQNNAHCDYKPTFKIGYRKCQADYPVCLGRKSLGDLSIVSNAISYNDYAEQYYQDSEVGYRNGTLYYTSGSTVSKIGQVIGHANDTDVSDGRAITYYTAYIVIYCTGSHTISVSSDPTGGRVNNGTFKRYDSGNNHCVLISIADEWGQGNQRSIDPSSFNARYMGYTT
ncbi:MAG: hypothetical protein IJA72_03240 [Clostridia bacterium]|nr:hypothetical protein [Clostridia bacterium]